MRAREIISWLGVGAAGLVLAVVVLPRAFPFFPWGWEVTRAGAREIALERLAELGPLPEPRHVSVAPSQGPFGEDRLLTVEGLSAEDVRSSPWLRASRSWTVSVYEPGAPPTEWSYRAQVSAWGDLALFRSQRADGESSGAIDRGTARQLALDLLRRADLPVDDLEEPSIEIVRNDDRTDLVLTYTTTEHVLGPDTSYGVRVLFQGDQLAGWEPWVDGTPAVAGNQARVYLGLGQLVVLLLSVLGLAVAFVRRYHRGEVGVERALQLLLLLFTAGLVAVTLSAGAIAEGSSIADLPRSQTSGLIGFLMFAFVIAPIALLGSLAWAVGESIARERHGEKLAAFDAFFRGEWNNATVAASSLRGTALGLALFGTSVGLVALTGSGLSGSLLGASWGAPAVALATLSWLVALSLPGLILSCLLLPLLVEERLGFARSSLLAAGLAFAVVWIPYGSEPLTAALPSWWLVAAVPVLVFRFGDLLSALLTGLVAGGAAAVTPLLGAANGQLQLEGALVAAVLAVPLLVTARHLRSSRSFTYHYDDVPLHVRRIAERERQRVELETAREIQASILPDLPSTLVGIEIAHAYRPATEVGGDFYDVLALEDGRLAVAVGDVSGHGVSSGLVMSMVRSALAVQVAYDPQVSTVLQTLNRMVYQNARRHLLATLAYAILDPQRREIVYASAGHLFPFRISRLGRVDELGCEDGGPPRGAYPLGVRSVVEAPERRARLDEGDYLVLLSDGVVEARGGETTDQFGFDRLTESLARHAGGSARSLCDGLLADVDRWSGSWPQEDDVTLLVLRLPDAA